MRNPIRLKNLKLRFLPYYIVGALVLMLARPTPTGLGCGIALVLAGSTIRTWGAGHLVKNDQLTVTGPYARLRHPLYLGTLLTAVGFGLAVGGVYTLALLAFLLPWFFLKYFPRKERSESQRLEMIYGPDFNLYRENVPALLPRLRAWCPEPGSLKSADAGLGWSLDRYSDNNELGTLLAQVVGLSLLVARTLHVF